MMWCGQTVNDVSCFMNPTLDGIDVKILAIRAPASRQTRARWARSVRARGGLGTDVAQYEKIDQIGF